MKNFTLSLAIVCILCLACRKSNEQDRTPTCLENSIAQFVLYACDTGATVKEYRFQGKIVYLMEPGSCGADMQSIVLDRECNNLGALGGITGNTKIDGVEFSTATYIRTVWHN